MASKYPVIAALARADHYSAGRARRPLAVVIHATAGTDSLAWLRYASNPPVSCHVLVTKGGTRFRIVEDRDRAWHAGRGHVELGDLRGVNPNEFCLGLELENLNNWKDPYPYAQIESASEQLAVWHSAHGRLHWFWHGDMDPRKWDAAGLDYTTLARCYASFLPRV